MASSYSTQLRFELQATGENRTTWGSKANTGFNMVEDAIAGCSTITMSDANYSLTTNNGTADEARSMMLVISGTHTAIRTLTIPTVAKTYIVYNATTGGFAVTLSNGTSSVTIANGSWYWVWTDGTTVRASTALNSTYALSTDLDDLSGVTSASTARTNLGLGTIATQASSNVTITGGSVTGITDIAVADGGTGASTAAGARTNLGLVIGTDVQAFDADLSTYAGKTPPSGTIVGTTDSQTLTNKTLTSPTITSPTITGGSFTGMTDIAIADGGTGASTAAAAFAALKQAATETSSGVVEQATADEIQAATADKYPDMANLLSAMAWETLTDAATVSVNHADGVNRKITIAGNRAFGAPSNGKVGWPLNIWIVQDGTGSRVPTWNAAYDFGDYGTPTLTTTAGAADLLTFVCLTTSKFAFLGIRRTV